MTLGTGFNSALTMALVLKHPFFTFSTAKPMLEAIKPVIIAIDGGTPEVGECKARGWPVPRVTWWRKGTNLRNYDYLSSYILTRYAENWLSMKITTIEGYHHGTHTCRADNLFGTAVENVIVMVKRKYTSQTH